MTTVWGEPGQSVKVGTGYKRIQVFGMRIDDDQGGYDVGRLINGMVFEDRYQKVWPFGMRIETCIAVRFSHWRRIKILVIGAQCGHLLPGDTHSG
jgi:hypothetical protein